MVQKLSKLILRLFGWKLVGQKPKEAKYITLCAPHTSNFDALWFFITMKAMGIKPEVMIKSSYHRFPLRWLFKKIGGIPVERGFKAKDLAQQMVAYAESVDELALMLAPEGSRSYQKYWKQGFYQIAEATGLPIYFGFADYAKRELGFGDSLFKVTGDLPADMQVVRDFYTGINGRHLDRVGPIRLKRESK